MDSIKFPDMFSTTSTNLVSDSYEVTLQNLKLLLGSEQGSLFGDPFFGLNLRHNMYEQNFQEIWDDLLLDKIYTAIVNFMPQILVKREDIILVKDETRKSSDPLYNVKGNLSVVIKAQNQSDFQTNMYNIVLFQPGN